MNLALTADDILRYKKINIIKCGNKFSYGSFEGLISKAIENIPDLTIHFETMASLPSEVITNTSTTHPEKIPSKYKVIVSDDVIKIKFPKYSTAAHIDNYRILITDKLLNFKAINFNDNGELNTKNKLIMFKRKNNKMSHDFVEQFIYKELNQLPEYKPAEEAKKTSNKAHTTRRSSLFKLFSW